MNLLVTQFFRWFMLILVLGCSVNLQAQIQKISTGSFIVNMGVTPQTVNNGLKPYGMIYDLVKNYNVPVYWVINQTKAKDGTDFTHNSIGYRGGTFIIPASARTTSVNNRLAYWQGEGVVGNTSVSDFNVDVTYVLTTMPRWAMDSENGSIAITYLTNAGIPNTAYYYRTPAQLNPCDDIFVMPHADPTWSTHGPLFNFNRNQKGAIYSACRAVSQLEGTACINPNNSAQRLNFLTTNGMVLYNNHGNATPPFSTAFPTDPVFQNMGITDGAHETGAEQIYYPTKNTSDWRATTKLGVFDPTTGDIPSKSNGPGAIAAYGRGFGVDSFGLVMYHAGHRLHPVGRHAYDSEMVSATRQFFNFSFLAAFDKAPQIAMNNIPTTLYSAITYTGFTAVAGPSGNGPFTYQWSSTIPGTFSNASGSSTSFTPSVVAQNTPGFITVTVTDACGRSKFASFSTTFAPLSPISNNTIVQSQAIHSGTAPATFTGSTPNGGTGSYTYAWEKSTNNGSSWSVISGASNQNFTDGVISTATYYRRIVNSAPATASTSNVVRVTMLLSTTTSSVPVACNGDSTGTITVTPSGGSSLCMPRTFTSPATCTNCTQVVSGSTTVNMNQGDRVCVLANTTYTGSVNMNGGEFIVCGTANPSNFSSNGGTIYINGSMHVNVLNLGSNLTVHNYGTLTANTNITGSGRMYNFNTITLGGDYNVNSNGVLENYGTLTSTGATFNNSGSTTNNGTIQAHRHVQNNSNTFFINNCTVIAGENFNNNSTFTNNGSVSVGLNTHLNSQGHFVQGKGGSLTTNSIHVNSTISGPVSGCASVQVATTTTINSSGTITGRVDFCDANGIETNTGTMNNTIAACTCQEYSPNFDASYSYAWSNGATTPVVSGLPAGVYSITVLDAHNNPSVSQVTITEPSPLVVTTQHINSTYPGAGDGSITLSAQGGAGNYAYVWNHGPTTPNLSGLNAGTYTVTVTDANGCSANHTIVIGNSHPLILSNIISANQTILSGNIPVHFTGSLPGGGTGTYQYQWQSGHNINGPFVSISGATSQHYSLNQNTGNLFFRRLVTSSPVPVSTSNVVSLTVLNYTLSAMANSPIIEGQTINLSAIPGNPGGTFTWAGPNGYSGSGIAPSIPNAPMAAAGLYTVTWTVDNVVLTAVRNVIVLPSLTVVATGTNERYPTALDGTVTATVSGGTGPFSYLWNTGDTTITVTGLPAGTYTVIATDANGFRDTANVTIVNNVPYFNLAVCYEGAIGTPATHARYGYVAWNTVSGDIQINTVTNQGALPEGLNLGNNVFTRLWSTNAYPLNPFHYVWTFRMDGTTRTSTIAPEGHLVTPQNSCGAHFPVILDNTITSSQTILSGTSPQVFNGSLPTGGTHNQFTYQWERSTDGGSTWVSVPSGTTKDFPEGLISVVTAYRRIVSSWSVAPVTSNVVVVTPIVIPVTPTHNGPVCAGALVQLSANTVAGATYSWAGPNGFSSNAQNPNIPSATVADAGVYSLSITVDGVTNTSTTTLNINQITAGISKTDVLCFGFSTGSADLTVSGGSGNYGYQWSNNTNSQDQINTLAAGTYSVLASDLTTGCQAYATVEITQPSQVVVSSSAVSATYPGSGDGSVQVQVSGGTPGYTYQWAHGPTNASLTGLNAGTYTVMVRDANQCEKFDTLVIGNTYDLIASNVIQASQTILSGTAPQLFTGNIPTGGTGVYTYNWQLSTDGGVNWINYPSGNQANLQEGILNFVTHYRRIISSGPVPALTSNVISVTPVSYSITASNSGPVFVGSALSLNATPSTVGGTYSWSGPNGFTASVQNPVISSAQLSDAGVYTVYQHIDNVTVSATTVPVVYPTLDNVIAASQTLISGNPRQTLTGNTPTGGTGTYTYQWEMSTNGGNSWTTLTGATQVNFPGGPIGFNTDYRRIVTSGSLPPVTSNIVSVVLLNYSITASNNGPIFEGSTLLLSAFPSQSGGTFTWVGPNGYTGSGLYPIIQNAPITAGGVYTVTQYIDNTSVSAHTLAVVLPMMSPNTITASQTILSGSTPAPFDGSVMSGGTGSFTYQWERSTDGGSSWTTIVSATSQNFPEGPLSVLTSYRRLVSDGVMPTTTSNVVSVTPVSYSITASNNGPVFVGSALNLYSTPSTIGGTYSWTGPNGFTANVQNPIIGSAQLSDAGVYTVYQHIDNVTVSATTVPVVLPVMSPNTITASQTILSGTTPAPFDGSVMSGGSGSFTYQWERSTDGGSNWTTIVSATGQNFPEGPLTVLTSYRRMVSDAVMGSTTSNIVTVTPLNYTLTASATDPMCVGWNLDLFANSNIPNPTYVWSGPSGFTAIGSQQQIANASLIHAGNYTVTVSKDNLILNSVVNVPIANPFGGLTAASAGPVCEGQTLVISATVLPHLNYTWFGPNGFSQSGHQMSIPNAQHASTGIYTLYATNGFCTPQYRYVQGVVNVPNPNPVTNSPVCETFDMYLTAFPNIGAVYNWSGPNGFTATGDSIIRSNALPSFTGRYYVTGTIPGCGSVSDSVVVVIGRLVNGVTINSNTPVCENSTMLINATPVQGANYIWSGPNGFTSLNSNLTLPGVTSQDSGVYTLTVTSPGCAPYVISLNAVVNSPSLLQAVNNGPICTGGSLSLSAYCPFPTSYSWSGPLGFTGNGLNVGFNNGIITQTGVYSVSANIPGCGQVIATTAVAVNEPASILTPVTNGPLCTGMNLQLSVEAYQNAMYLWTGPSGLTTSNRTSTITRISENFAGIYSIQVTVPACGVYTATTSPLNVRNIPLIAAFSPTPLVCESDVIYLYSSVTRDQGTSAWYGPDGWSSNMAQVGRNHAELSHAGVYTFVANVNGCGPVFDLVTIGVNSRIPLNYTIGSNTPICQGGTLTLTAQDLPGANYLWTGPNGFSSTSRIISTGNVQSVASGQYFLTVSKASCVPVSKTTNVFVGNLSLPVLNATSPICAGDLLNIRTDAVPDVTYSWSGPNGFTSNNNDFYIVQANPSHSGVYSLNANVPGCGGVSNSISVTVNNPFPVNPLLQTNSPICEGSDLIMEVVDHPSAVYLWEGPNGFSSNNRNPRVNFALPNASGIYSVNISVPGCPSRSFQFTNQVNALPVVSTSVTNTICAGQVLYLNASVVPPVTQVSWAGPNGFSSNVLGSAISNAQTVNSGTYTFFVNVPGCGLVQNVRNVIVNSPVNQTTITGSTVACVGNSLALTASQIGNASYLWTGPLGFSSGTRELVIPNIQLNQAGQYSLTVVQPGCNAFTATRNVSVNYVVPPVASVDRTAYCSGQPIYLSSTAVTGALAYQWTGPAGYSISNSRWPSRSNSNITHAGEYTLSVPTTQCGTFSTTVQVVVGPAINVTSATSNSPACAGGALNLMSNIPDAIGVTHTWIAPNATTFNARNVSRNSIDITAAGTYTYIVSSPGCGTVTRTTRVSVTNPSLVAASSNGPICQGQVIYFTGTGPAGTTYSWQGPGGYMASTQFPARSNAQVSHAGVYTLNANVPGCGIVSTTTSVVVNVCRYADENAETLSEELPAENLELISSMKVYPNPFSSEVNVEWGDMMVFSIQVYDMNGKLVRDIEPGDVHAVKLEAGDLPSGVYLMKALTSAGPVSYRITRL